MKSNHGLDPQALERTWIHHRNELIGRLLDGKTIYLNGRPLIGGEEVECAVRNHPNVAKALRVYRKSNADAGAMLAYAHKHACIELVDQYGSELYQEMVNALTLEKTA